MLGVQLARFRCMMRGMKMMPVRGMRVVRRLVVVAAFVVLGGVAMMLRGLGVMMRGFFMMLREFVGFHSCLLRLVYWRDDHATRG
jgi:hypothetical protein